MLRVKVSIGGSGEVADLSQFVGNSNNSVGDCKFFVNERIEEADVWFVSEDVEPWDTQCQVPASRTVFITSETSWGPGRYVDGTSAGAFLNQFSSVYTCHDVFRPNVTSAPPFLPWMINANHGRSMFAPHLRDIDSLRAISRLEKAKDLSVFCSAQQLTADHRMRLRFVERLKDHFGDLLDWYGNGINPVAEKWDGIAPYRYTIVLENQSTSTLFTEKIYDAFLGLAYPIYWGAPDLGDYFDPRSFAQINIRDLSGSIGEIERLVASNVAETRQPELLESRNVVLDKFNLFGRLADIAQELADRTPGVETSTVRIEPISYFEPPLRHDPVSTVGRLVARAGNKMIRSRDA